MFDIGFFELVLIGVVSLVVLGPEKLPGAIRTVSLWVGRLRRSFNTIKQDIEREIGADEIRRTLRNEEIMEKFKQTQASVKNTINSVQNQTEEFKKNLDLEAKVGADMNKTPDKSAAAVTKAPLDTASPGPAPTAASTTESSAASTHTATPLKKPEAPEVAPANPRGDG